MSETLEEFDISNYNTPVAGTKIHLPSINGAFTSRKKLFSNDQEVIVDSEYALVLLNDANLNIPLPGVYTTPTPHNQTGSSRVLIRMDSTTPKKDIGLRRSTTMRRRGIDSQNDSQSRRISNTLSYGQSDTAGKDHISEVGSAPKVNTEVDIFCDKGDERKLKPERWVKMVIRRGLDSTLFNTIIFIVTIYTLFAEDVSTAILPQSVDLGFDIVNLTSMGIFVAEIVLSFYSKRSYRFSFFFWLDVLSTVSLLLDIDFMTDNLFFPEDNNSIQKGGQASFVEIIGSRTGRVVRIVRLVRLVKFYKQITKKQDDKSFKALKMNLQKIYPGGLISERRDTVKSKVTNPLSNRRSGVAQPTGSLFASDKSLRSQRPRTIDEIPSRVFNDNIYNSVSCSMISPSNEKRKSSGLSNLSGSSAQKAKESRVGKKLSDMTTKRVIVLMLVLLIFVPFLSADFFFEAPPSQIYQMEFLASLLDADVTEVAKRTAIDLFISEQKRRVPQLIFLKIGDKIEFPINDSDVVNVSELRRSEAITVTIQTQKAGELTSIVDDRLDDIVDSSLAAGRTLFVFVLLTIVAILVNNDTKRLLLIPLERIIEKVNRIAGDPQLAKEEKLVREANLGFENEAVEVENAIVKIAGLLALGFGDAGSAIITQNMASLGDMDPMLRGKKKAAIYGFCDIRNFTDVTEVLQEDVMIFVNSIAEIVHSMVDKYTGAANKNIGDAFLLVWKFPEDNVLELSGGRLEVASNQYTRNIADCALISFLKIYARINRDPTLLKYRDNPKLNARLPNYKVKMGFGLHLGWAIEGAIGSDFKIDASYLSPNVNMASRLEAATKQYGVPLLFSGELYDMMSEGMKENSRLIDVVAVKGSNKATELYTVDLDIEGISVAKDRSNIPKELKKVKQVQKKDYIRSVIENSFAYTLLESDKELRYMLRNRDEEFNSQFNTGVDAYIDGDWSTAKKKFEVCLSMRQDDGPTKNLMRFLAEYDFIAPDEWEGYHVLTEK